MRSVFRRLRASRQAGVNPIIDDEGNGTPESAAGADAAEVIAAVDLGSNSFHMIVGGLRYGQLAVIDRLRETVRLAEGLEKSGKLNAAAEQRALDCLARFGERLRHVHAGRVRAAGTSTLRRARDSGRFLALAGQALGHPIDIISGVEEARLIYKGVLHNLPPHDGHRLVLDIGGGSTELILGDSRGIRVLESLHLGCVAMTERYFPDGRIGAEAFHAARLAARLELRPVKAFFRHNDAVQAIGTSGTIRSAERVARECGVLEGGQLTPASLDTLIERVTRAGSIAALSMPGLSERRAQVWPGGLAILAELLAVLRLPRLQISDGALREGLLYELLGRLHHEDARERTVRALATRYSADESQAGRVATTALALLDQCRGDWQLDSGEAANLLKWAAELHEIGLDISHDGYQRHGAYIAAHADMPGFPRTEQSVLAFLIANHRRQLDARGSRNLPSGWRQTALRLALLLRLAVLLHRSRNSEPLPEMQIRVGAKAIALRFPAGWLVENPLTVAELLRERDYLAQTGHELRVQALS